MLGGTHSWAVTMRNLLQKMESRGHHLHLKSINGTALIPTTWNKYLNKECLVPDLDLCYTMPRNFHNRFMQKAKLKMAIYNYETSIMPAVWNDKIKFIDYALPSSEFSKEIFIKAGWPKSKCIVVPHGINPEEFSNTDKISFGNNKSFKFLNVSIAHYRKNIDLLVDAYYSAFSSQDDVCLILKTQLHDSGKKLYAFECDVIKQISEVQKKYLSQGKDLPQIEILQDRLDSMIPLYNSCDVLVSATSAEGFGLPLLEGLAANMLVIAPNCSGHIDFLNDKNSLLIKTKIIPADARYEYWSSSPGSTTFLPEKNDLAEQMFNSYKNKDELKSSFNEERLKTINKFTWDNAAKQILDLK